MTATEGGPAVASALASCTRGTRAGPPTLSGIELRTAERATPCQHGAGDGPEQHRVAPRRPEPILQNRFSYR